MTDFEKIRTAFERQTRVVELRPGMGTGTAKTTARVVDGLTCEVSEGEWKMVVDMNEKWGGNGRGPNSGMIGRGALGSCMAISYMMWAARMNVQVDALQVEIRADYDTRGICGVTETRPGYQAIRYVVTVESPAPEAEVYAFLDASDAHCTYLDVFSNGVPMKREVKLNGEGE